MRRNWLSMLQEQSPEKREGVSAGVTEVPKPRQNPKSEQIVQGLTSSVSFGTASLGGSCFQEKPKIKSSAVWNIFVDGCSITVIDMNNRSREDFIASMRARFGDRFQGVISGDGGSYGGA